MPFKIDIKDVYRAESYIEARRHMITCQVGWWKNLPKLKLGFDILEQIHSMGYECVVLTKGPSRKFNAWSEKVEWCRNNLTEYISGVTITEDKGLVYGKILVDDYPDYCDAWLKHRPRGLVIMPAQPYNEDYKHPNAIRYDGTNMSEVVKRILER